MIRVDENIHPLLMKEEFDKKWKNFAKSVYKAGKLCYNISKKVVYNIKKEE